jgi:hypothetical protein
MSQDERLEGLDLTAEEAGLTDLEEYRREREEQEDLQGQGKLPFLSLTFAVRPVVEFGESALRLHFDTEKPVSILLEPTDALELDFSESIVRVVTRTPGDDSWKEDRTHNEEKKG